MRTYLITTGGLFAAVSAVHVWRMTVERHLASDPWYLAITLLAVALTAWSIRLLLRLGAKPG